MVLIFSRHANASEQVRREVERAIIRGRSVLPVRIENVLPDGAMEYALGNMQWLDAFTPPAEPHLQILATCVKTILGSDVQSAGESAPTKPSAVAPVDSTERSRVTGYKPAVTEVHPQSQPNREAGHRHSIDQHCQDLVD
jgi:hypothetical protein